MLDLLWAEKTYVIHDHQRYSKSVLSVRPPQLIEPNFIHNRRFWYSKLRGYIGCGIQPSAGSQNFRNADISKYAGGGRNHSMIFWPGDCASVQ